MFKKILIINPFGVGDVLFSTPLIHNLRFYYPDAFIAVAVQKKVAPILENNPHINEIIPFSRGDFKDLSRYSRIKAIRLLLEIINRIAKCRFDLCIDLSLEHRYSLILKILGVRKRLGFNFKGRGRFLTHKINIEGYTDKHVIEYHLGLLEFLGKEPKFKGMEIFLKPTEKEWARNFLHKKGISDNDLLVGIIPGGGGSWGRQSVLKHWAQEKYAQVADALVKDLGAKLIIFADRSEKEISSSVITKMHYPAYDTTAATDLRELAALISRCSLIIANDGGPVHIACALGIKTISIFGPVDEAVYGPYPQHPYHTVIKHDFDCRPCYRRFRVPECTREIQCLETITAEEIVQQAEQLLKI